MLARLVDSAPPSAGELPAAPERPVSEMPVRVRVRSFPATIRETSSRPNRHLYFRATRCRYDLLKIVGLESGGILPV